MGLARGQTMVMQLQKRAGADADANLEAPGATGAGGGKLAGMKGQLAGLGYAEQAALLAPAGNAPVQKKDGGGAGEAEAVFDKFALSDEVRALFVELAATDDPACQEELVNTLHQDHGVPQAIIAGVLKANEKFWPKAYQAVRKGSWSQTNLDASGAIKSTFTADGKGFGWDAATWSLDGSVKDQKVTYTDKDDHWTAVASVKDQKVTVDHADDNWSAVASVKDQSVTYTDEDDHWSATAGYKDKAFLAGKMGEEGGPQHQGRLEMGFKDGGSAAAKYGYKDEKQTLDAKAGFAGGKVSADGKRVLVGEDGVTTTVLADAAYKKGQLEAGGGWKQASGDGKKAPVESTELSGRVKLGEQKGGSLDAKVVREGYSATANADVLATASATTVKGGGTVVLGGKKAPKDGDTTQVTLKATGSHTDKKDGEGTTQVHVSGGLVKGDASAKAAYDYKGQGGYAVHSVSAEVADSWDLDEAAKEKLTLKMLGVANIKSQPGAVDTFEVKGVGQWVKGEGDGAKALEFSVAAGKTDDLMKATGSSGETKLPGIGAGYYGRFDASGKSGKHSASGSLGFGGGDGGMLAAAKGQYAYGDKAKVNAYAAAAKSDGDLAAFLKVTGEFAASKDIKLSAGGEYKLTPGNPQYEALWKTYVGMGYNIQKGMDLTLKLGVADNGEHVAFVPEVEFMWAKKLDFKAVGVFGSNLTPTAAGIVDFGPASIFAGVGDMSNLTMAGHGGMMPGAGPDVLRTGGMGAEPFVGVKIDLLKLFRKK